MYLGQPSGLPPGQYRAGDSDPAILNLLVAFVNDHLLREVETKLLWKATGRGTLAHWFTITLEKPRVVRLVFASAEVREKKLIVASRV